MAIVIGKLLRKVNSTFSVGEINSTVVKSLMN